MSLLEILAQFPVWPLSPFLSPTSRPREHRPDSRVQTDLIIGPPGRFLVIFIFILHHRTRPGTFGPLTRKLEDPAFAIGWFCDHSRHAVLVIHTGNEAQQLAPPNHSLRSSKRTSSPPDDNKDTVAKMVCKLDLLLLPRLLNVYPALGQLVIGNTGPSSYRPSWKLKYLLHRCATSLHLLALSLQCR